MKATYSKFLVMGFLGLMLVMSNTGSAAAAGPATIQLVRHGGFSFNLYLGTPFGYFGYGHVGGYSPYGQYDNDWNDNYRYPPPADDDDWNGYGYSNGYGPGYSYSYSYSY